MCHKNDLSNFQKKSESLEDSKRWSVFFLTSIYTNQVKVKITKNAKHTSESV